jgi:hypothetical protein
MPEWVDRLHVRRDFVSDYSRPTAERLGIITSETSFWFYDFRHSLTTFLIGEGQNPDAVRRMLR